MTLDLKKLIGKLNATCHRALEQGVGLCVAQTHFNVEVEHLLLKVLEVPDTDVYHLLRYYEVTAEEVEAALRASLDALPRGNARTPALSPHLVTLIEEAWVVSSLHLDEPGVRSGTLLLALLNTAPLLGVVVDRCPPLLRIPRDHLKAHLRELIQEAHEAPGVRPEATPDRAMAKPRPMAAPMGNGLTALTQYTQDLTAEASAGKLDPIRCREAEIRQVIDILLRRRQNNPILTGAAGVGKTAVVEGFAQRVADGDVPPPLLAVRVLALDVALLQAGAGVKGEFEARLKQVIDEVQSSPAPIVLFVDEAHTLIGAGGAAGLQDAANLLKPALARGALRTIAATTQAEYKKYVEKDAALARRFQVVQVDEPDEAQALVMLRGLTYRLEAHHGVRIQDAALVAAVGLSRRYIAGRCLPDKAISVLDTACARVAVGQHSLPAPLEGAQRAEQQLTLERQILTREARTAEVIPPRLAEIDAELVVLRKRVADLSRRWEMERAAVHQYLALREAAEAPPSTPTGGGGAAGEGGEGDTDDAPAMTHDEVLEALATQQEALMALQQERPLVPIDVDPHTVAAVIAGWTGIPVGKMLTDALRATLSLEDHLRQRVVGQDPALGIICRSIQVSRARLSDPDKPAGVFLLAGPSGVGKTETALAIAEELYAGHMVHINLSEYQEAHTVSKLKGAPAGYVGFGQGGVLTEAVRRTPYAVVLLDELEKAHPDVHEVFYQVFDKGMMEDAEGTVVDFRHTILLLTTNLGSTLIEEACRGGRSTDYEALQAALYRELLTHFPPAFVGRLVVVPYTPLTEADLTRIVQQKLSRIQARFTAQYAAALTFAPGFIQDVAHRCPPGPTGARSIDHHLSQTFLPDLSLTLLEQMAQGGAFREVVVGIDRRQAFTYQIVP